MLNRRDLVNKLADDESLGLSRKQADAVLGAIEETIKSAVASGEPVALSGFLKAYRRETKDRMGRNPATGAAIKIKGKKTVKIVPLKAFKDAVLSGKAPKKAPAKKAPAKKTAAKKAPAKKAPAKKTVAKKAPAKKVAAKRR